jgi:hypothetical protein
MGGNEIRAQGHPGSGSTPEATRPADHPARRDEHDWESLLVEIAWLVIEGSRVLWRLRRILARV